MDNIFLFCHQLIMLQLWLYVLFLNIFELHLADEPHILLYFDQLLLAQHFVYKGLSLFMCVG